MNPSSILEACRPFYIELCLTQSGWLITNALKHVSFPMAKPPIRVTPLMPTIGSFQPSICQGYGITLARRVARARSLRIGTQAAVIPSTNVSKPRVGEAAQQGPIMLVDITVSMMARPDKVAS